MNISTVINNLKEILEKHGDLEVCTAKDDEGNGYSEVYYNPTVGIMEDEYDFIDNKEDPTHVCLN